MKDRLGSGAAVGAAKGCRDALLGRQQERPGARRDRDRADTVRTVSSGAGQGLT